MELPEFLTEWPFGEIVLTGHRIGLYHVAQRIREGLSPEQIHEYYPSLPLDLVVQVVDYMEKNRTWVDEYVAREQAEIERQMAEARPVVSREELQRRFEARKKEMAG